MTKPADKPRTVRLADYRPPAFAVPEIALDFDLREGGTRVRSRLEVERRGAADAPLELDGDATMRLVGIALDGTPLDGSRWHREGERLIVAGVPDRFTLEIETEIRPEDNTRLEGLFMSGGIYCTQCEAEGFRNIAFFPDRPDVMSRYRVRIAAEKAGFPVLLSNGNLVETGDLAEGRHYAIWEDPFPKPCYLFALVAGDLDCLEDRFTTCSGREVVLRIHAAERDLAKCRHAMESLKHAMRQDEEVYGREYDLDIFNIVAVADFNMGAMENKSLNIFNTKYILADPEIATDADFDAVEGVVAHEYFHNWTGNRVTCRDWFQLSLKEGLTVFRDQQFSADRGSAAVKRIEDVRLLRAHQFPEDAGPMAHPVRPDSYIEINNFYTATVYNKGAEVIRMLHAILGAGGFRRGMDLYFERHDGAAVTCDDFVAAMADATGADLTQFKRWYSQAGTPVLRVESRWDEAARRFRLEVRQQIPPTPGQPTKSPMHIPLAVGLVGPNGDDMDVELVAGEGERREDGWLLHVTRPHQIFEFGKVGSRPVPSLLRGFSAPVQLSCDISFEDALFLLACDRDPFARQEAGQEAMLKVLLDLVGDIAIGKPLAIDDRLVTAMAALLDDRATDPALLAEALTQPSELYVGQRMETVAVEAIHEARAFARAELGRKLAPRWREAYERMRATPPAGERGAKVRRALAAVALGYLAAAGEEKAVAAQYRGATNMTDRLAALRLLVDSEGTAREAALADFYDRFRGEPLAIDKWFAVQALSSRRGTVEDVERLAGHAEFTIRNPNRLRALVASFSALNQQHFHDASGRGYRFLARMVAETDRINPQTAARILTPLTRHKRFDDARAALMRGELEKLLVSRGLSRDVYEIASKSVS